MDIASILRDGREGREGKGREGKGGEGEGEGEGPGRLQLEVTRVKRMTTFLNHWYESAPGCNSWEACNIGI